MALKEINNKALLENISIYGYYGNYNNSYVIRLIDAFNEYPAVVKELAIADVIFQYSGPSFLVWVNEWCKHCFSLFIYIITTRILKNLVTRPRLKLESNIVVDC